METCMFESGSDSYKNSQSVCYFERHNIDKWIEDIFPMKHKIVPEHSTPVAIMGIRRVANVTMMLSHDAFMDELKALVTIRGTQIITISSEMESPVVFVASSFDAMTIEQVKKAKQTRSLLLTWGINGICPNFLFQILVMNFSQNLLCSVSIFVLLWVQV